jgi:hypothetical protein
MLLQMTYSCCSSLLIVVAVCASGCSRPTLCVGGAVWRIPADQILAAARPADLLQLLFLVGQLTLLTNSSACTRLLRRCQLTLLEPCYCCTCRLIGSIAIVGTLAAPLRQLVTICTSSIQSELQVFFASTLLLKKKFLTPGSRS